MSGAARGGSTGRVQAAVVVEWHPYDVRAFQELLWILDDVDAYVQPWDIFVQDPRRGEYDVVLYYNMSFPAPPEGDPRRRYVAEEIGTSPQGLVLLHHGILSYETWPTWNPISGTTDRSFAFQRDTRLRCEVVDPAHPITEGLADFEIVDEAYAMAEPTADNHVLLTTDSADSVRALAWTREFRNSRVFCYQSGHDAVAWQNPGFRHVLQRGVHWAARRIG